MDHSDYKPRLHEKVLLRQRELESSLKRLRADARRSDRARAIGDALTVLHVHLSTEWNQLGAMQSAALVDWLNATRDLPDEAAL